ncbi:hypothetical protein [Allosalinactinospora lopnorensis]|uniref:hypothetical protein n=1 Tax=Allosalinactinospora lopnorensis TaxID=1352348 RepID=UPI000623F061|nr:hypothetical protein [Allosalinactinospora lopnorensis]
MIQKDVAAPAPTETSTPYLWVLRAAVLIHAALVVFEFGTAGQLIAGASDILPLHSKGAIMLHAVAGFQLVAATLFWRPGRGSVLPLMLSTLAFALGFLQAYLGSHGVLDLHVVMGMTLVVLVTWVFVWSWTSSAHRTVR